tara:strand:+ start:1833 stop:2429 length:597 start_codon:yes stop_codon:yes gene_type:complete
MNIQYINPNELKPYYQNPRKNLNVDKVATSIREFGFQQPIVVDSAMVVVVGHTRLEASKELGLDKVPVLVADLPPEKAKAYRIADNKLNEGSEWDYTKLHKELGELLDVNYELENLGFHEKELEDFITHTDTESLKEGIETVENKSVSGVVIQYNIIFDNDEQQQTWFNFIKFLKSNYPNMDTIGERLTEYIKSHGQG